MLLTPCQSHHLLFLPFSRLSFHFVENFLCFAKALCLIRSGWFIFISFLLKETDPRKYSYGLCRRVYCQCSLLEVLWFSILPFRTLNDLEFVFVYGKEECSNLIILHVAVQFFCHHLLNRLSFPPLYILDFSVIDWLTISLGFISGVSILFHWPMCQFLCQYHTGLFFLFFYIKNFSLLKKKTHLNMNEKTSHIMGTDICKHNFFVSQSLWNRNLGMA